MTCPTYCTGCVHTLDVNCRAPDNPKTYLRAAQARIGLGPGEYDDAASLLNQALAKAKEQNAPTKGGKSASNGTKMGFGGGG